MPQGAGGFQRPQDRSVGDQSRPQRPRGSPEFGAPPSEARHETAREVGGALPAPTGAGFPWCLCKSGCTGQSSGSSRKFWAERRPPRLWPRVAGPAWGGGEPRRPLPVCAGHFCRRCPAGQGDTPPLQARHAPSSTQWRARPPRPPGPGLGQVCVSPRPLQASGRSRTEHGAASAGHGFCLRNQSEPRNGNKLFRRIYL